MSADSIKTEKLLLVEGRDEFNFFSALLAFLNIHDVTIIEAGGCKKFASLYPSIVITSGFSSVKRIGFVRDAEANKADSAFQSILNIIKKNTPHFILPKTCGEIVKETISCGIFIMPNNKNSGMLEDLCLKSVEANDLYKETKKFIEIAKSKLAENDSLRYNIHKAKVQAYLAGTADIPRNLGEAALKKLWDFSNPVFDEIKQFIIALFL